MNRLFFGFSPNDATRQLCQAPMQAIAAQGLQTVPLANLHVTLLFLGTVNTDLEAALKLQAASIPFSKVAITFDRLSYWQESGVLCLTASKQAPELLALVEAMMAMVQPFAIALDERPYQAHVTLSRKAKQSLKVAFKPITWQSEAISLFQSCSTGTGVEYRILQTWPATHD